jgi:SAM-dependent methyltransferase
VRFQVATVYELPFPDASFDAVFAHGLLDHLAEPFKALREMRRVLPPGGLMGVRSPDFDGHIVGPTGSLVAEVLSLIKQAEIHDGQSPCVGRDLRGLLHQVGCTRVIATASYECHGTPGSFQAIRPLADAFEQMMAPYVPAGLVSAARLAELVAALRASADDPAAFVARPWCEAVGWVE